MFDWMKRSGSKPPGESEVVACSFCKKTREQVSKLIAGPGVMICGECVALSAAILEEDESERRFPMTLELLVGRLASAEIPREDVKAASDAALRLAGYDTDTLRWLTRRAFDVRRYALAVRANGRIEDGRTFSDTIDGVVGECELGNYDEAHAALATASPETPEDRALLEVNRVAVRFRREPNLDVATLEGLLADLDDAKAVLDERYHGPIAGNRGECLLRLGRPADAKRVLEEIVAPTVLHRVLLGDAETALGNRPGALEHYRAASGSRGPLGELARRRLGGASSDPYR